MDQLSELFQPIIDFILGNIGIVIFAVFLLSGFFGRDDKKQQQQEEAPQEPQRQQRPQPRARAEGEVDNRPLAERLAEAFGVEIPEEQMRPQQRPQPQSQPQPASTSPWWDQSSQGESEGRRSTTFGNVQDNYPELFGGPSMFEQKDQEEESTRWGFDETEWGTTFDSNEDQWSSNYNWGDGSQWGNTFPERKSDEPQVHWPT